MNERLAYIIHEPSPWILAEIREFNRIGKPPLVCICNSESQTDEFNLCPLNCFAIITAHFWFLNRFRGLYFKFLKKYRNKFGLRLFNRFVLFTRTIHQAEVGHIHAHFATTATELAKTIARLLSIEFSFTAHAYDIFKYDIDKDDLITKMDAAQFTRTVSRFHQEYLLSVHRKYDISKIKIISYGVDTNRFHPIDAPKSGMLQILAIGNLVEKKGFRVLIDVCYFLALQNIEFICHIIGHGPRHAELTTQITDLNLNEFVKILKPVAHKKLNTLYNIADMVVSPCIRSVDGDMDGIPNVLIEAMAAGRAVISTRLSGIPELIDDHRNGLLVEPGDRSGLLTAIVKLYHNRALRSELGRNARAKVFQQYNIRTVVKSVQKFIVQVSYF